MRTGDPLRLLVLLTAVPLSSAAVHQSFNPSTATCSAPIRAQLDPAPLSSHDQDLLQHLLPQPTVRMPSTWRRSLCRLRSDAPMQYTERSTSSPRRTSSPFPHSVPAHVVPSSSRVR
ncbi:hypothetical protein, variant 2 [Phytophthora nicotianae INRA-310]|uniref:RxLR effector protein n=1 Tax=Phytophthora nicotianae (strain INRA-310) TaxID=761204 RepID=W2PFY5_PHYN3|nr:hypothetical protein, variant 2 [Phytophthora nicotianae INRA-310]ETM99942.1 hypothetical protein, variant 2 [Phytophthora nicotianae INRA-310]